MEIDGGGLLSSRLKERCSEQILKGAGVDVALDAARLHAASNARLVCALALLARYKTNLLRAADDMGQHVRAAVEARRAKLEEDCIVAEHRHPLLAMAPQEEDAVDADGLLLRLAAEEEAAKTRVETALREMPHIDDLPKLNEDEWRMRVLQRDLARQDQVQLAELRIEGLRAKQHFLERALSCIHEVSELDLPELTGGIPAVAEDSAKICPLLTACSDLVGSVHAMHATCGEEVRAEIIAIATRISSERECQEKALREGLRAVSVEIRQALSLSRAHAAEQHMRRVQAEGLLGTLETLQEQVKLARKEERKAQMQLEDLEDDSAPGDPELEKAQAKLERAKNQGAALLLRRDGVVAEVATLSATMPKELATNEADDAGILPLDFPELPLRAQRIVQPFRVYADLDETARARFDVEVLLRRAGLLACDRSYNNYTGLALIVSSKPNVKRASLRGAAPAAHSKLLKEYGVDEFKRVKRAVIVASRLRHPGIVPVECAFMERGNLVVVQSPFLIGGNMRQWSRDKDLEARLRSLQRVAEAVRFLHAQVPSVLHRDLKSENVVFDSAAPTARPALCDFDISITASTIASTMMRGTLLYLAPDPDPSTASDVFALGMTVLDVCFCDSDEERLRSWVLGGKLGVAEASDLQRVRSDLERCTDNSELASLVRCMLIPEPKDRPSAGVVAERLGQLLNVRTCCVCHCPEPRDEGLACSPGQHFACDECFSRHISRLDALCDDDSGDFKCFAAGCAATFTPQQVAKHASPDAWETAQRRVNDRQKVALQSEFQEWKERFEADFAAKSELERRVLAVRKQLEEAMDLRCPKCRKVFSHFTGCAALTCAYAGCGANFCALCLSDCGGDAHAHVRSCRLNPTQNEYFVSEEEWRRIIDGQRREKLEGLWAGLEPEVKEVLAANASIAQIMRDLGLEGLLAEDVISHEMVQLRGMGFVDESGMRRALQEAGGDVAAAIELLYARERGLG